MRLPSVLLAAAAVVAAVALPVPASAAVLGDPGKLAFYSSEQAALGLVGSGGGAIRLPVIAGAENPAWSPDGLRIAYDRVVNGNRDIYVAKADGTGEQRVTIGPAVERSPAWSPDGVRLAYVSNHFGKDDIYTADADGVGARRLTDAYQVRADSPSWAPDGSAVVFGTRKLNGEPTGIARASTAGTGLGAVQQLMSGDATAPELSPDGTRVVYLSGGAVWVMSANGSGRTKLPVAGYQVPSDPTWSPDGQRLAFSAYPLTGGGKDVFWMYANGTGVVRVTSTQTTELQPSWQAVADRTLRVGDATVAEAGPGQTTYAYFELRLDQASWHPITVRAVTLGGTASSPSDYAHVIQKVTFSPGQVTRIMSVPVAGDDVHEQDETFSLLLDQAIGASLVDDRGLATIHDDDAPTVSVSDVSLVEGDAGQSIRQVFTIRLSKPSTLQSYVTYSFSAGTATSPTDFSGQSGTAHFEAGDTSRTVVAWVNGDTVSEDDETFALNLGSTWNLKLGDAQGVATIRNDEPGELSVADVSALEPAVGTADSAVGPQPSALRFELRLAHPTTRAVRVRFATADGTATAGVDYVAVEGIANFAPGTAVKVLTVPLLADALVELDETVNLSLGPPTGGLLVDGLAVGTIVDDDCPAHNCS